MRVVDPKFPGFEKLGEGFDLLRAPKDPGFQPTQVTVGPDGALYVVDGRGMTGKGRVYRVHGTKAAFRSTGSLTKESDEKLLESLKRLAEPLGKTLN